MKIATFNINNIRRRLPNLLAWLRAREARRRLPAGAEGHRRRVSGRCAAAGRLRGGLARPEDLERRRDPRPRRDADRHAHRALPGDPDDDAEPLHRGRGQRRADRARFYAPNGNPQPGPKFDYKLAWMQAPQPPRRHALQGRRAGRAGRRLQRRADRPRHLPDQILRRRRAAAAREPRGLLSACSRRAGSMPSARCIRTRRCTRSGTTCGSAGSATPACASTRSC